MCPPSFSLFFPNNKISVDHTAGFYYTQVLQMLTNGLVDQQNNGTPFSSCEKNCIIFHIFVLSSKPQHSFMCSRDIEMDLCNKNKGNQRKNACLTLHIYSN